MLAFLLDGPSGRGRRRRSLPLGDPHRVVARVRVRRRDAGREQASDRQRGEEQRRAPHSRAATPKCSRTIGATSRSVHCSRSAADSGPQPTKSSGPSESPACRAPWLPPPAWVTPPQSTASKPGASETTKSPACGAVSADQTRASGIRVGLAAQPPVLDRRLQRRRGRPRPPSCRRAGRRPRRRAGSAAPHSPRSTTAHSPPPSGIPGLSRTQRQPVRPLQPADQVDPLDHAEPRRHRRRLGPRPLPRQQVDVGGAAGRADRQLRQLRPLLGGLQHRPLGAQQLGQRQAAVDVGLGVVGEQDHRVARRGTRRARRLPRRRSRRQASALAIDSTLASGPWWCE